MKYGLLYYKETDNLGDDIQTYAAKQFLPRVDYIVDRESLNCFVPDEKEYVSVIMNAWYMHNKSAWPPSPYIKPLLTSMHFSYDDKYDIGDRYLLDEGAKYLNKNGPVGARDENTMSLLEKCGINTYFSGCMTLTIKRFENILKQDYICVVDAGDDIYNKVKENTSKEVRIITHSRDPEQMKAKSIEERMLDVEKQLKEYQAASLIITNRLHVVLPALALGTPVILVRDKQVGDDRIKTFEKYVTHYQVDQFLEMDINELINNPNKNKDDYLEIRNKLTKMCEDFISFEEKECNEDELPNIEEYKKNIDNIKWHNDLFFELRKKLGKSIDKNYYDVKKTWEDCQVELENVKSELTKELNKKDNELNAKESKIRDITEQLEERDNKILELQSNLDKIYNSRTWKLRNKVVNAKNKIIKGK